MTAALRRRLNQIEAEVLPKPETPWVRLIEPDAGASEAEREKYAADLAEARAARANIFIRRLVDPPAHETEEDGTRVFGNEVEMEIAILAAQPSKEGNRNLLEDIFKGRSGAVAGVANWPL